MKHTKIERSMPPKRRTIYGRLKDGQRRIASAPSSYLAYCFLIPASIMLILYLAMELHPFGNGTVLVLDLNGQYVSFFEGLRRAVWGDGSFLYTFSRSLGGEFMGIYAYYLASPLSYLVALFPQFAIQEALLCILLVKVGLCGLSFGWYLHRRSARVSKPVTVAFACMYALCAYSIVYQNNLMWMDAMMWLPVLTHSVERLIRDGRYKLFVAVLSLTVMSNYYIGYMVCLYVALYFCYVLAASTEEELNPHGKKHVRLRALLRIALSSLLALAIAAFVLVAAYYSLSFGKSTFSIPSWSFSPKFDFLDLFTKLLPGSYDTVRPSGLPLLYCGTLVLLLVPVYFASRGIRIREKLASLGLLAVFVLSMICSPTDLIWHGFQAPNWLNYRYSFMLCLLLLTLAYKGIGNLSRVGSKFVIGTCGFWIAFAAVCNKLTFDSYLVSEQALETLETVWLTIFAVVILGTLLCLLVRVRPPKQRESVAGILLTAVCLELFCNGIFCMMKLDEDVSYATYSSYHDYIGDLSPIVEQVKEYDPGFYRMEKRALRKYNDNMALGIRGLAGSTSTLHADAIAFLCSMGYASRSHFSQYLGGTPVSDSLLGIRYWIDSNKTPTLSHYSTVVASTDAYTAYQNPYALSLAYGVDASITEFEGKYYDNFFERMNGLVGTMLGDASSAPIFRPISHTDIQLNGCAASGYGSTVTYTATDSRATVCFTVTAPYSGEYFFYTPSTYPTEVTLSLNNGITTQKYLGSNTDHIVSAGYHEAGEEITVYIELAHEQAWRITRGTYFWYLDPNVFADAFTALLQEPQFLIDPDSSDDHLIGTVVTEKDKQTMQTTIPYDEGWQVYVDGEQVAIFQTLDALIAFDIDSCGSHTVELKYRPSVYTLGAVISGIGLLVFLGLCAADVWRRKRCRASGAIPQVLFDLQWDLPDLAADCDPTDDPHASRQTRTSESRVLSRIRQLKQRILSDKHADPERSDPSPSAESAEHHDPHHSNHTKGDL